jgi:hypothetical protein
LHAWPLYYTKIFHLFIYNNCCCNKIDRELLIIIEEWDGGDAMEPVGHGWDGWSNFDGEKEKDQLASSYQHYCYTMHYIALHTVYID